MKNFVISMFIALGIFSASDLRAGLTTSDKEPVLTGVVKDGSTGNPLPWATIYIEELKTGTTTNGQGQYTLGLKPGTYRIKVHYYGYEELTEEICIERATSKDFTLQATVYKLKGVKISDRQANNHVAEAAMSVVRINTEAIKKIPALMGETDLLKTIQMLPGVQNTGEGFSGFSVRGGSTNQNLVLLDEATVYNPAHLMGFFSVFNSDAIEEMTLYKGDIPARHGGRLSSLLDVQMKEGNPDKLAGSGGIGTVSSRLTLEGPVTSGRSNFVISGRRTYADMFLKLSKDSLLNKNRLYFYDLNGKLSFRINNNNKLQLSAYTGRDFFSFREIMGMEWANQIFSARLTTIFHNNLTGNLTYSHTRYDFDLKNTSGGSSFNWASGIRDHHLRYDLNFYPHPNHIVRAGLQSIHHTFMPGTIKTTDHEIISESDNKHSMEHAIYISGEHKIGKRWNLQPGLRFSICQNIGADRVYLMDNQYKITDTLEYAKNEFYHTYSGLEPRLSTSYLINKTTSLKASLSRTRQYVQPASNTASAMPHDIWFTASPNIKPQIADQACLGFFKNLFHNTVEASVEIYYKTMDHQIDFRDNANMLYNTNLEGEIRIGTARAYGAEFLLRKSAGKFTGWIGYTLSKSRRKVDEINQNQWYNASYDKPHNFIIVASYEISDRITLGANWTYTSEAPTTLPTSRWEYAGMIMPAYSERNGYRLPDYHRLDLSTTIRLNKSTAKHGRSNELNISVYNAYNRKNPFTIFFEPESRGSNNMKAYSLSMFGIVPSITWNFRF